MMALPALLRALGRGLVGAAACFVARAMFHGIVEEYVPQLEISWSILTPWAFVGFLIGTFAGALKLQGKAKFVALGIPTGLALGLVGAYVYAIVNTNAADPVFAEKFFVGDLYVALPVTVPSGLLFSMTAGWFCAQWKCKRRA
ncbi:MAG: hypothetical protein HY040_04425 [Planctomycetes bacterium]|nr:hypothetical protein [Planctomycetota bacterium]